jgi:ketosteroid isomerase-like protein
MEISKEYIIEVEQKLIKAIASSDISSLDKALHDDLLFIAPNGQVITKQMDIASHKAGAMVVEKIVPTIEAINILDDCAIVVIVYDTKGKMLGTPIEGKFRYIRIWKLIDGTLKVIGGSCLQIE